MKNVLVIGYKGEIGSALVKVIEASEKYNIFKKDVEDVDIKEKIDIMHICIPFLDNFVDVVVKYINKFNPGLVIINSTVSPGTTKQIYKKCKCQLVHSPVRGKHPNLDEGLIKAVKFIGPVDKVSGEQAKEHFDSLGINTEILNSPLETELGKLFSTTYYALCIAYHQEMERICKKFGADFEQTVTRFNETYNELCKEINPKAMRPVLFPGLIGGHCLMPNINILKKNVQSSFLDVIEKSNNKKKESQENENS